MGTIENLKKKRKFLLVLPLMVLPFITMIAWGLGVGKTPIQSKAEEKTGLNKELPSAKLENNQLNKMSLYAKADKDSQTLKGQAREDLFLKEEEGTSEEPDTSFSLKNYQYQRKFSSGDEHIQRKLAELEQSLQQPAVPKENYRTEPSASSGTMASDIDRLESMITTVRDSQGVDPEIQQLATLVDKLNELQNPGLARERLKSSSLEKASAIHPVSSPKEALTASLLSAGADNFPGRISLLSLPAKDNGFYTIDPALRTDTAIQTGLPAVVHETQTLVSGASIKLRLTEDIVVSGMIVPKGSFVSGECSLSGERLKIEVKNIRYNASVLPVSLTAFDLDGIEGISIPDAISRDAAKDGADRAIQSMQLMSLDPSLAAQAAGAGVEAAKGLFSKKIKLIRVTVKAGHPLLLVDAKAQQ